MSSLKFCNPATQWVAKQNTYTQNISEYSTFGVSVKHSHRQRFHCDYEKWENGPERLIKKLECKEPTQLPKIEMNAE